MFVIQSFPVLFSTLLSNAIFFIMLSKQDVKSVVFSDKKYLQLNLLRMSFNRHVFYIPEGLRYEILYGFS